MQNTKTILALDLGTTTGWALYDFGSIASGSLNLKAKSSQNPFQRFINLETWLPSIFTKTCGALDIVYYEKVRRHLGTEAAHIYGAFEAEVQKFCIKSGVECKGVDVGVIKKSATGKGDAKKEKVIEAIKKLGHNPKDDNEADALALLYYALKS